MSLTCRMLSPRPLAACAALLFAALTTLNAQSVATTPVGAMVYSFPATGSTSLTSIHVAFPLTAAAIYTGPIQSATGNSITVAASPFTSNQLAQSDSPYILKIASGTQAGRRMLITANTANTITVDVSDNSSSETPLNEVGFSVAQGDRIEIFPADTIAGIFGTNGPGDPIVIAGGSSALVADTINIYNKATLRNDIIFFSTTLGHWRTNTATTNINNRVIFPEEGLVINRRANRTATSLTIVGEVPKIRPLAKTTGSGSVITTSTLHPADTTLAQLNIANWTKSNNALTGDTLSIYNPLTLKNDVYFQRTDNEWRLVGGGSVNRNSVVIPAGTSFTVLKRNSATGANSFLSFELPYSL